MSLFTTQLRRVFDSGTPTRVELAQKSGIQYATLSNYATGRITPDSGAMQAICGALETRAAAALAAAWVGDLTDGVLGKLVRVEAREPTPDAGEAEWRKPPLNGPQREAIEKLARAVIKHTEWEQLLYALTDVLSPDGDSSRGVSASDTAGARAKKAVKKPGKTAEKTTKRKS